RTGSQRSYPCKPGGPNDYCLILFLGGDMWNQLCRTIRHPELIEDERFAKAGAREKNLDQLEAIISEWTMRHTKHEVMRIMGEAGVPCGAVLDAVELLNNEQLKQRGMMVT